MHLSLPMALADFVPVGLFLAASVLLQRDLYNKMSKGAFALFAGGTIMVFLAGACKALWKLLYAIGLCDFTALSAMFFPMQTAGFVLAALALIALLTARQGKGTAYAVAAVPPVFSGTMLFVALTLLGTLGLCGCLSLIALRIRRKAAALWFVLAFILMMAMGYLSSRDFSQAASHWMAEGVNILGQGALLLGVMDLHRHGLASAALHKRS